MAVFNKIAFLLSEPCQIPACVKHFSHLRLHGLRFACNFAALKYIECSETY